MTESGELAMPGERVLLVADFSSPELVLAALTRAGIAVNGVTAVLSAKEAGLVTSACLASVLGARAVPWQTAVVSRDKALQKARVRMAGIACAPVRFTGTLHELAAYSTTLSADFEPGVVKPAHGVATGSTRAIGSATELAHFAQEQLAADVPADTAFVLESRVYFDEEWHLDGVVRGGALDFLSVGRYFEPRLNVSYGAVSAAYLLDPHRHGDRYALARPFAQAALEALGIRDGVFHLEAFHRDGTLTFGECAVRPGGNGVLDVIALKYQVDLAGLGVDAILDRPASTAGPARAGAVGYTTLPSLPGVVVEAPSTVELLAQPGVRGGWAAAVPGLTLPDMRTQNRPFGGLAVLTADDEDALTDRVRALVRWYAERTRLCTEQGTASLLSLGTSLNCAFVGQR
jgi:hypothetical protein